MKRITPVLWTVLGIGMGVSGVVTMERLQAQQQPGTARIVTIDVPLRVSRGVGTPVGPPPLTFIRDTKTNACWIGSVGDGGGYASLAVAPEAACQ